MILIPKYNFNFRIRIHYPFEFHRYIKVIFDN